MSGHFAGYSAIHGHIISVELAARNDGCEYHVVKSVTTTLCIAGVLSVWTRRSCVVRRPYRLQQHLCV